MSLNDRLVAMSETQPWTSFALRGLNFQFLKLNFQFLEGNFKMSEPCGLSKQIDQSFLSLESKPFRLKLSRCCSLSGSLLRLGCYSGCHWLCCWCPRKSLTSRHQQ